MNFLARALAGLAEASGDFDVLQVRHFSFKISLHLGQKFGKLALRHPFDNVLLLVEVEWLFPLAELAGENRLICLRLALVLLANLLFLLVALLLFLVLLHSFANQVAIAKLIAIRCSVLLLKLLHLVLFGLRCFRIFRVGSILCRPLAGQVQVLDPPICSASAANLVAHLAPAAKEVLQIAPHARQLLETFAAEELITKRLVLFLFLVGILVGKGLFARAKRLALILVLTLLLFPGRLKPIVEVCLVIILFIHEGHLG